MMSNLTDLEIRKRFAESERLHYVNFEPCNPLTDDALCFQLIAKYRVQLYIGSGGRNYAQCEYDAIPYDPKEKPNRAVCRAIMAAKGI